MLEVRQALHTQQLQPTGCRDLVTVLCKSPALGCFLYKCVQVTRTAQIHSGRKTPYGPGTKWHYGNALPFYHSRTSWLTGMPLPPGLMWPPLTAEAKPAPSTRSKGERRLDGAGVSGSLLLTNHRSSVTASSTIASFPSDDSTLQTNSHQHQRIKSTNLP